MPFLKTLSRITHYIWSLFLNGLFTILPIALTLALFNTSFQLIANWLKPLRMFMYRYNILINVPYAEVIFAILAIFCIGAFVKIIVLRPLLHILERLIFRIPLVRPVYSGIKQLVEAFNFQNKVTFKQVVMVEFPRKGMYSIGFLTGELADSITPHTYTSTHVSPDHTSPHAKKEKFYTIFIPTTPNPTTGFLVMLSEKHIHPLENLTRQEAMTMVISGGIVQPERFTQHDT